MTGYLEQILEQKDVFLKFSRKREAISFHLPFNLPLVELRIYLGHFGITLYELYRFMEQPPNKTWPARLDLSAQEVNVVTKPDIERVQIRYGSPSSFNSPQFDVQEFLRRAGIERNCLDDLLKLKFNPDLSKIQIRKKQDIDEIQFFTEYFSGLKKERLDFIHRFIRLWRKTGWTIQELDLILCALKDAGLLTSDIHPNLDDKTIEQAARLVDLQQTLKLSVEELCAFVHQLPVFFWISPESRRCVTGTADGYSV